MTTIELRGVDVAHGDVRVFADLDLTVPAGLVTALLGASGSGKTSLLRVVAGLAEPDAGTVVLGGVDVAGLHPRERQLGYVPQGAPLLPDRDVARNLAFPLRIRGVDRDGALDEADRHGRLFGLRRLRGRRPDQLSTGERAAAGIARGTIHPPRVLLLDEPVPHLDPRSRVAVLRSIGEYQQRHDVTMLVATNDIRVAVALADRVAVIDRHRIVVEGPLETVRRDPRTVLAADLVAPTPLTWVPGVARPAAGGRELRLETAAGTVRSAHPSLRDTTGPVLLGLGNLDAVLTTPGTGALGGRVARVATTGPRLLVSVETAAGTLTVDTSPEAWVPPEGTSVDLDVRGGLVADTDGRVLGRVG